LLLGQKNNRMLTLHFFRRFGKLFYSIASDDEVVDILALKFFEDRFLKILQRCQFKMGDDLRLGLVLSQLVFEKSSRLKLRPKVIFEDFSRYYLGFSNVIFQCGE